VAPSPKSQVHEVTAPVDWSVKAIVAGARPDVGVAVKSAVGLPSAYATELVKIIRPMALVFCQVVS